MSEAQFYRWTDDKARAAYYRDWGKAAEVFAQPGLDCWAQSTDFFAPEWHPILHGPDFILRSCIDGNIKDGDVKRAGPGACNFDTISVEMTTNNGNPSPTCFHNWLCVVREERGGLRVKMVDLARARAISNNFESIKDTQHATLSAGSEGSKNTRLDIEISWLQSIGCILDTTEMFLAAYQKSHGDATPESLFTPDKDRDGRDMPALRVSLYNSN